MIWFVGLQPFFMFSAVCAVCKQGMHSIHAATFSVAVVCFAGGPVDLQWSDWFAIAKRTSLLLIWPILLALSAWPKSPIPRVFARILLHANVAEIALYSLQYYDIAVGVACILLAQFSPYFVIQEDNELAIGADACVWFWSAKVNMPARWYFRAHYVFIAAFYMFAAGFSQFGVQGVATLFCIAPLLGMELFGSRAGNVPQWFLVRAVGLLWGTAIDLCINHRFWNTIDDLFVLRPYQIWLLDHIVVRNLLQFVFISSAVFGFAIFDRKRATVIVLA